VSDSSLAKISAISADGLSIKVSIITSKSSKKGFDVIYGDLTFHVTVTSL